MINRKVTFQARDGDAGPFSVVQHDDTITHIEIEGAYNHGHYFETMIEAEVDFNKRVAELIGHGYLIDTESRSKMAVILDGGLVQGVVSDSPSTMPSVMIIDYDIEGAYKDEIYMVPQNDGSTVGAIVSEREVEKLAVDLADIQPPSPEVSEQELPEVNLTFDDGVERDVAMRVAIRATDLYAKLGYKLDRLDMFMSIAAVHLNGCPLDLSAFLAGDDIDFSHDIGGIMRHLDSSTGKLRNCFIPRFALRADHKETANG